MKCKKLLGTLLLTGAVMFTVNAGTETRHSQKINDGGKRLQSREIFGHFEMNGVGSDANWGFAGEVAFRYEVTVKATSKIIEKKIFPNGRIHVVEERKFDQYTDYIQLKPQVKLDFSTLPVEEFREAVRAIGTISSVLTGDPSKAVLAEGVSAGVKLIKEKYDGKKLHISPQLAEHVIEKFNGKLKQKTFVKIRPVEGQTYRITYLQDKKGRPLKVKFENVNGKKLSKEEELAVKRCNAFVNYNILPETKNKRVGGSWEVNARDMEEIFDPFVPGYVVGGVKFVRNADNRDKNWNIAINPAKLYIRKDGENIGNINLKSGKAVVEPKKFHNVIDMSVEGSTETQEVSEHHLLFKAKVSSECSFTSRFSSKIIE